MTNHLSETAFSIAQRHRDTPAPKAASRSLKAPSMTTGARRLAALVQAEDRADAHPNLMVDAALTVAIGEELGRAHAGCFLMQQVFLEIRSTQL